MDAINVTDNQTAMTRMSSLAACVHLKLLGIESVLQMVTRNRNRVALQSDILGAASFEIPHMLCLSGDHQSFGDNPNGQNVRDLDSMQLIQTVRHMRDQGRFLGGDEIKRPPKIFVGPAARSMDVGLAFIYGFIPLLCIIDKFLQHRAKMLILMPDGVKGPGELEIPYLQTEQLAGVEFVNHRYP